MDTPAILGASSIQAETVIASVGFCLAGLVRIEPKRDSCRTQVAQSYCYGSHGLIPRPAADNQRHAGSLPKKFCGKTTRLLI